MEINLRRTPDGAQMTLTDAQNEIIHSLTFGPNVGTAALACGLVVLHTMAQERGTRAIADSAALAVLASADLSMDVHMAMMDIAMQGMFG